MLYILLWTGQIKDNDSLLNIEIDSEFLMSSSKLKVSNNQKLQISHVFLQAIY